MGADAVMNVVINSIQETYNVGGNPASVTIQGIEITGFAIKRK